MARTKTDIPVNTQSCKTCPFREDGWTYLRGLLEERAMTQATPICHSTGQAVVGAKRLGKARLCRGARDYQLEMFFRIGFLDTPTDGAWQAKRDMYGV